MAVLTSAQVRDALREVPYPGFSKNIVAAGFIAGVAVSKDAVIVDFAPNSTDENKVKTMEEGINSVLQNAGFAKVRVRTKLPYKDADMALRRPIAADSESDAEIDRAFTGAGVMTPLQYELQEDGIPAEPDLLHADLRRQEQPPGVGFDIEPPEPMEGPVGVGDTYDGALPVFQWEIDPHDSAADNYETSIRIDDWEIRVWWQVHPVGELIYASLQAMREDWADHAGAARQHPVGRSAAVNLVFDRTRNGVVAIYGTVRDFRPFVEAFRRAYEECRQVRAGNGNGAAHRNPHNEEQA